MKIKILISILFTILIIGCNPSMYKYKKTSKGRLHYEQKKWIMHPEKPPKSWKYGAAESNWGL